MSDEPKWNVLLVEDDPDDYILTRDFLFSSKPGQFSLTWAESYDSALQVMEESRPDVILVDFNLGGRTGLDFLQAARLKGCRAPAILLTGQPSYELDVEAMKAGVSDYLEKAQLSAPLIERAIRYAIERQQIQGRLEEMNEALEARVAERTRALEETNAKLRSEQALLNQVLEILPVGVWITDAVGEIKQGNPTSHKIWQGARYVGIDQYQQYKGWWLDSGEQIAPEEWAAARAVTRGEISIEEEIEIECFDGSRKIILNSSMPLRGENSEILGAIIVNQDITDRKRAALRQSEAYELFERVFSMLHMAIAYLDRDFNFIRVNRRYAQSDGRDESFFPGKNHFALYPNADNEAIFRQVVETGQPFVTFARPFFYPEQPERGATYWDWSLQPVKEPDGIVSGLILSLLDVTERQLSRQALEYQAYLLENVNDAIVAVDLDLCYISWNQAAEQIYGWKREEVAGRRFGDMLQTEFIGSDREDFLKELVNTGQYQGEVMQTCKDGRRIPVDMKINPLHDGSGNLAGYVSIQRDITLRREAEEQARQAYARVEAQAELSRLLAGANLDYRKMLEILTRRVAELIGDACQVAQLSGDGQALVPVAFYHPDPEGARVVAELLENTVNKVEGGFGGLAAKNGTPVLVPVVPQEEVRGQVRSDLLPFLDRFGIHSLLVVPLIVQEKIFGILSITRDRPGRPYSTNDQVFLEALAGRAALLIDNATLYEEAQTELAERKRMETELNEIQRRLADGAEAERLKLARELHDGPIQDMYALSLQLRLLDEAFPGGEDDETLAALQGSIQRVIDSLRTTSMELRPPVLARFGLAAAIRSHCEQFRKMQPGLKIQLELPGDSRPSAEQGLRDQVVADRAFSERARLALFRIYQVALTNVARHAQASQATIRLKYEAEVVVLEIEDNGVGFLVPARWVEMARKGHLGLLGGVERAESLGGRMQVLSSPGKGTIVRVVVPREA